MMAIRDWPLDERPREKFLHHGAQALSDAELLAILLRIGTRGKTALDLARDLLNQYGNLRTLLEVPKQEICQHKGFGEAKYVQIQAALEIARRHLFHKINKNPALLSSTDTKQFLIAQLRHYPHEVFACLFVDTQHSILQFKILFNGTIDEAPVYPREIAREALKCNAAAVILAHNHPSGIAEPSTADQKITKKVIGSLALIDVQVLDHIIVGDPNTFSFAENGIL
jgi:DNA repair protein RadC